MESTNSPAHTTQDPVRVDTLNLGFGFSVIPLLRELESSKQPYTLLSHGEPIWQQLAASDRLDFDLVSSYHASFYAEDQVAEDVVDNYYPTAREFYEYHERLFAKFRPKVTDDRVVSVDNHLSYSVVHTASGAVYEPRNLVFAPASVAPRTRRSRSWTCERLRTRPSSLVRLGTRRT